MFPSFFAVKILKKTSPKVSMVMTFKIFDRDVHCPFFNGINECWNFTPKFMFSTCHE